MSDFLIDPRQLRFLTRELWPFAKLLEYPRFAGHSVETFDAVLDASRRLASEKFAPHNRASDQCEPTFIDGHVQIIPEVKQALDAYAQSGFCSLLADERDGGLQLPYSVALLSDAFFLAANVATTGYFLLARGVANLLGTCASADLQRRYRQPLLDGRYLGTMCLSEPQAGSSLADISTRAARHPDGDFRITGQKMWISAGDHELSENIVHMVLARIAGAPAGIWGLSLFLVPRFVIDDEGRALRNDVRLAGVNHKLGQRGIVNTFLKFGENDACIGFLVGKENQGLGYMFQLMNEARIGVGMGAIMQGMAGYLYSLGYARERRQGRHPDQKDPGTPALPLIEHADVRRMLLQQKAYCEGAFALALYAGTLVDAHSWAHDPVQRAAAGAALDFLTPVIKSWSAEWCCKANDLALQVLGGYGYTREYPVEQNYRDNRLNPIHEGSNGIQALDLLGRKAVLDQGAALAWLLARCRETADEAASMPGLHDHAVALRKTADTVEQTTQVLLDSLGGGQLRLGLANASLYLTVVGHCLVAWMWLRQAVVATQSLPAAARADQDFYRGKLATCQYFFRYELPLVDGHAALLQALDDTTLAMRSEFF